MTMQADQRRKLIRRKRSAILVAGMLVGFMLIGTGCNKIGMNRPATGDNSSYEIQQANRLISQGNYEAALLHLQQALTLSPEDPQIHQSLGWLYLYTGELAKAQKELERLVQVRPEAPQTMHLKGALLAALDQPEDAVNLYQQALEKAPESERLYFDLATSLAVLNRNDEALESLETGFEHIPETDVQTHLNYLSTSCAIHSRMKQFDQAIEDCQEAVALTTNDQERQRLVDMIHNMKLIRQIESPNTPVLEGEPLKLPGSDEAS